MLRLLALRSLFLWYDLYMSDKLRAVSFIDRQKLRQCLKDNHASLGKNAAEDAYQTLDYYITFGGLF